MQFKKSLGIMLSLASCCFTLTAFAVEPIAKEDTNPLQPEGALSADLIPPITTIGKPIKTQQPTTNTQRIVPAPPTTPANMTPPTNAPTTTTIPITNPSGLNTPISNPPKQP